MAAPASSLQKLPVLTSGLLMPLKRHSVLFLPVSALNELEQPANKSNVQRYLEKIGLLRAIFCSDFWASDQFDQRYVANKDVVILLPYLVRAVFDKKPC